MGNRVSAWRERIAAKKRSDAIDLLLEEDRRRLKRECKILVLGTAGSGYSTLVRQMKIVHQNGFTDEELMTYRPTIHRNTIHSAQAIVLAIRKIGLDYVDPNNNANADCIISYTVGSSPSFVISPEIAKAIDELWKDPVIPKLMDHSSEFHLMDCAVSFLNDVLRIGSPNYLPTENDVLRANVEVTGITETRFIMGQLHMCMIDVGGQRSERKKWIHCFECVTSIIFCVSLADYDQVLLDEKNQNRLVESLIYFESLINSRWFLRTSIILFFTKIDAFKEKLPKIPLERYFPEYSGGADVNKAAKYILWRFMQTNRARLSVYPHLVQEMNTSNIRLVFAAVKETVLQNALKDSGRL